MDDGNWYILLSLGSIEGIQTQYHGGAANQRTASSQIIRFGPNEPAIFIGGARSKQTGIKECYFKAVTD